MSQYPLPVPHCLAVPAGQTQAPSTPRHVLQQYHKQLVASRTIAFHQQTMQMMSKEEKADPEAKRQLVVRRVAREIWTNFTVRGQDTPMLRHLCQRLCQEYGETFIFEHRPGGFELIILRPTPEGHKPVSSSEMLDITNKAWLIALELVESYAL